MTFQLPTTDGMYHLPKPSGRYFVGCIDIFSKERESKLPLLYRLYYPTAQNPDITRWPLWLPHPKYTENLAKSKFENLPFITNALVSLVSWMSGSPRIPANLGAPPHTNRHPLVVFSHGLMGVRNTYSTLCADIASQGFYVAALEHGDKSASVRMLKESPDGEVSWLDREVLPAGAPEGELRARQLQYRSREVSECLDSLGSINAGDNKNFFVDEMLENPDNVTLDSFKGKIILDRPVITGHSMGGATAIRVLSTDKRFTGGVALDSWMFPVRDETVDFDLKSLLFINCEKWQNKKNLKTMSRFETSLRTGEVETNVISLRGATHYAPSDILVIFQNTFVGKYILGRDDPTFNSYQKVLANSHLLKGWIGLLEGDSSSLLHACSSFQENLIFGIKKEKEQEEAENQGE